MHRITTLEQLDKLYGEPVPAAIIKDIDYISEHYRAFIDKAPFVVVATVGPEGLDCSPRGDPPGFVRVRDAKTVLIPDRRGNNRINSLRNIVRDPRISLLFIIPGIANTLRINGRAEICTDPDLLVTFSIHGKTRERRADRVGRTRLHAMSQGARAFTLVEPRCSDCPLRVAEQRRNAAEPKQGWHRRGRIRPRLPAAPQRDHLLTLKSRPLPQ